MPKLERVTSKMRLGPTYLELFLATKTMVMSESQEAVVFQSVKNWSERAAGQATAEIHR